jgi:hypothetical protein
MVMMTSKNVALHEDDNRNRDQSVVQVAEDDQPHKKAKIGTELVSDTAQQAAIKWSYKS